jgi:hypothetical protein
MSLPSRAGQGEPVNASTTARLLTARDLRRLLRPVPRSARRDGLRGDEADACGATEASTSRVRLLDTARVRACGRRRRCLARDALGGLALPADVRAPAGSRRGGPLAVRHGEPGSGRGTEPAAPSQGALALLARRGRRARRGARPRLRPARRLRGRDGAADERVGPALERRDLDRPGLAVVVEGRYANGVLTPFPKSQRSRRHVQLSARALAAVELLPPRVDTPLVFPAQGGTSTSTTGGGANGTRRSKRQGSPGGALTHSGTRSRPRPSPPASPSSSWPA